LPVIRPQNLARRSNLSGALPGQARSTLFSIRSRSAPGSQDPLEARRAEEVEAEMRTIQLALPAPILDERPTLVTGPKRFGAHGMGRPPQDRVADEFRTVVRTQKEALRRFVGLSSQGEGAAKNHVSR
jgi:hypothetical protein